MLWLFQTQLDYSSIVIYSTGDSTVGKSAVAQVFHSDGTHFPKNYNMVWYVLIYANDNLSVLCENYVSFLKASKFTDSDDYPSIFQTTGVELVTKTVTIPEAHDQVVS